MSDYYDTEDAVVSQLLKARTSLLYQSPFLGEVALNADLLIIDNDDWCSTAATDGRSIYFNRNFVISLYYDATQDGKRMNGQKRLTALLLHEVWHIVLGHLLRRGNRDADYWNMAADYVVNALIVDEKIGLLPEGALYDRLFTIKQTAEEVYDYLVTNNAPKLKTLDVHIEPKPSRDGSDIDDRTTITNDIAKSDDSPGGDIKAVGKLAKPEPLIHEEARSATSNAKASIMRTAQEEGLGAGTLPGGLQREIQELIAPRKNWRQLLTSSLKSIDNQDYTYDELSEITWASWTYHQKHWHPGCGYDRGFCAILPSQTDGERIEVTIALDTSGSITDRMLSEFLNEVVGIMETFSDVEVTLLCFDTKVHESETFKKRELTKLRDFQKKKIKGNGGTDFMAVWRFLKDNKINPDRLVVFTDGEPCGSWGDPDYCSTIYLIKDQMKAKVAPFGQTAYL